MISVITAVYNNTKYLRACVESVTHQDYKDIEYIIVDDGSNDGTAELCDELAKEDSRIRVVHQDNQWIYASFNNGIKVAKGEYVYIVNSDDKLCDGSLAKMAEVVDKFHPDVVFTKLIEYHCDENQKILSEINYNRETEFDNRLIERDEYIRKGKELFEIEGLWNNQANLYKRDLLLEHPFNTKWYGADALINISIADDIQSLYILKDVVYNFYVYDTSKGNTSVNKWYKYEFEMRRAITLGQHDLLVKWGSIDDIDGEKARKLELKTITRCIDRIAQFQNMTIEKKLENIMKSISDTPFICRRMQDSREEIEARILSGFRKMMIKSIPDEKSDYYFVHELLENLLRYEKDEKDFEVIHNAVNHELNPYKIGYSFEHKLKE